MYLITIFLIRCTSTTLNTIKAIKIKVYQINYKGDAVPDSGEGKEKVRKRRDGIVYVLQARAALVPVADLNERQEQPTQAARHVNRDVQELHNSDRHRNQCLFTTRTFFGTSSSRWSRRHLRASPCRTSDAYNYRRV